MFRCCCIVYLKCFPVWLLSLVFFDGVKKIIVWIFVGFFPNPAKCVIFIYTQYGCMYVCTHTFRHTSKSIYLYVCIQYVRKIRYIPECNCESRRRKCHWHNFTKLLFCFRVFFFSSVTIFETIMLCYVCRYISHTHAHKKADKIIFYIAGYCLNILYKKQQIMTIIHWV